MARRNKYFNARKYIFVSFLYLIRIPLLLVSLFLITKAILTKDMNGLTVAGVATGLTLFIHFVFLAKSSTVACRLCRAHFLKNLKCSKKPKVPRVFGSYTLPVALAIFTQQRRIRCPYCGEKHVYFEKKGQDY